MKRREFLKTGLFAGTAIAVGRHARAFQNSALMPRADQYELVVIKGGEPDVMFDRAIKELGGLGKFVKKGQTVVVKPNIGWDVTPERAGNTNPLLVKRIIEQCIQAGAKKVYVFDNTCDNWLKCYKNSGIEKVVKEAGGHIVPGNTESYYQEVTVPDGKVLKKAKVHELILDSDLFINVPVLKNHGSAGYTVAMKNLMGIVWDRRFWHKNNLQQCIADFATYKKKPVLNVVDAYRVMLKNGPRGVSTEDVQLMKTQILTMDMVAADAAGVKLMGGDPDTVSYITYADQMKAGNKNLDKLKISRIKL